MWHSVFIALHAIAGVVAFGVGCVALRRARVFPTYFWSLLAMALFLALAVGVGWGGNDTATRIIFAALVGLAGYLVWRAVMAGRLRPVGLAGPTAPYFEHIGVTLVGLFDGFVVIAVLRTGAPGWLLAATGVGIAIAGHFVLGATRDRVIASSAT